jgi:hypothetical protein
MRVIDVGPTKFYQLIEDGELETYLEGRSRKVVVASIDAYIERKLKAARECAANEARTTIDADSNVSPEVAGKAWPESNRSTVRSRQRRAVATEHSTRSTPNA